MESKNERIFDATQQTRDVTLCARGECDDDDVHSKEEEEKVSRIHSVTARALASKSRF